MVNGKEKGEEITLHVVTFESDARVLFNRSQRLMREAHESGINTHWQPLEGKHTGWRIDDNIEPAMRGLFDGTISPNQGLLNEGLLHDRGSNVERFCRPSSKQTAGMNR